MSYPRFPRGFVFGSATSAYQIEGGWDADGKGPSIWDTFAARPGKIDNGDDGRVACNTYHDFQTDIDIMRSLEIGAYRFSISWPRVLPRGRGAINQPGLDYYDRLVDALLRADIAPYVTLFHWDLPQALQDEMGGFEGRDCAALFADYAEVIARRLGDRVQHWITLNEPWVFAMLGHLQGSHAPGRINPWAFFRVVHHQLLGHALAMERLKALYPDSQVGITLNLGPAHPHRDNDRDRRAADMIDQVLNRLFLDPLTKGHYPDPLWTKLRRFRPAILPGDMELISRPFDFLGVNYYTRTRVRHAWFVPYVQAWPTEGIGAPESIIPHSGKEYTSMGWEIYPQGLYEILDRIRREYRGLPVYITENGAAFNDHVVDGRVIDEPRRAFYESHLDQLARAVRDGVDVRGYFAWSLVDNLEWAYGYDKRFGIVHVDHTTQRRTIKDSGHWYRDLIRSERQAHAGTDAAAASS